MNALLKVLMLTRPDAQAVPGGDTVQMVETKAGLEKLGVQVTIGELSPTNSFSQFDLIHIFNWQMLHCFYNMLPVMPSKRCSVVLSPIFWYQIGHWFDGAVEKKPFWNLLNHALSAKSARSIYQWWQLAKFRRIGEGRKFRREILLPDRLFPNSRIELAYLEDTLGIKNRLQNRSTIVYNAIKRCNFDPIPHPNLSFYDEYHLEGFVLQVARIQAAKNQLRLIEALFDLPIPIVFIGQPSPYESEYVKKCEELARLRGNVYFLGQLANDEVAGIYVLAGVHVLPSWRETPGLASLEAGAAGCRIVSTRIGSAQEYFGENAWYCDPGDIQSIRHAVTCALSSPPPAALRDQILTCYTWEEAAKTTLEGYHQAIH
jgi:glycosyltransferase involved in cell wall biosynthesis